MAKYYLRLMLLFCVNNLWISLSSSRELAIDYSKTDFYGYTFQFTNDNPFLNIFGIINPAFEGGNDTSYTHGLSLGIFHVNQTGNRWSIRTDFDLYTKVISWEKAPNYVPQYFRDLETIRLYWDNFYTALSAEDPYFIIGIGMGRVNDLTPEAIISGSWQQKMWHNSKHQITNDTPLFDYINSHGEKKNFIIFEFALGKSFAFNQYAYIQRSELDLVNVESGYSLFTFSDASKFFTKFYVDKSFLNLEDTYLSFIVKFKYSFFYDQGSHVRSFLAGIAFHRPTYDLVTDWNYEKRSKELKYTKFNDDDLLWSIKLSKKL